MSHILFRNKIVFLLLLGFILLNFSCKSNHEKYQYNLDFEKFDKTTKRPYEWKIQDRNNLVSIDSTNSFSGRSSLLFDQTNDHSKHGEYLATYEIPIDFQATKIEVIANFKYDHIKTSSVGLFLVINQNSRVANFLSGSSDWEERKIESLLYPEYENIKIVIASSGESKVWVDNIRILADGKDISQAPKKSIYEIIYTAERDKEFELGSKIKTIDPTDKNIENIYQLGLIWGFLKYYHPAVAKGNYNWDNELFRIMPKILSCENNEERDKILTKWIKSLGHFKKSDSLIYEVPAEQIKCYPDLDWMYNSGFSRELKKTLNGVRLSNEYPYHFYVRYNYAQQAKFMNEKNYAEISQYDVGMRILSLYRYWNMIQYYFPYKYLIGEDWKGVLKEFIPYFIDASQSHDFELTTVKLIARINDTHAGTNILPEVVIDCINCQIVPFIPTYVENQFVVEKITNKKECERNDIRHGDIITKINDRDVADIVNDISPFIAASNHSVKMKNIANVYLCLTKDTVLTVTFKRDNKEFTKKLRTESYMYIPKENQSSFKKIGTNIGYISMGSLQISEIDNVMKEFAETKGIVIDLREYPNGTYSKLADYLLPRETEFVKCTRVSMQTPGLIYSDTLSLNVGHKNSDYYKGKVIILINEQTQSQAEFSTMALRMSPNAIVVGSQTSGADGDISEVSLLGGITTAFSGIGIYYPDGTETQRIGIQPDVLIKPTIKGVTEGRDELMEKAIQIINE